MRYRSRYRSNNRPRTITIKYAGKCACCGGEIKAGEIADYYPIGSIASVNTAQIAHVGGLDGNSGKCTAQLRRDRDFVDVDRMYENQCADICGR